VGIYLLPSFSILKMKAGDSSEKLVNIYLIAQSHVLEGKTVFIITAAVRPSNLKKKKKKRGKAVLGANRAVRHAEAPPHFLDNRLTDGVKVVSLIHRPPFTPRKIPGTHFC
jgi:hypothetical protein